MNIKKYLLLLFIPISSFAQSCPTLADWAKTSIPTDTTQLIMVSHTRKGPTLILCEKTKNQIWQLIYTPKFPIQIGKNGIAPLHKKHEGDHQTPSGLYAIGPVFGSRPHAVKMDFRYITKYDQYIDDIHSPRYNTWVMSNPNHEHHEKMLRPEYQLGAVVQYNQDPVIFGLGSAIFIHLSSIPPKATEGCVALAKSDLNYVINWLDKDKHPYVYIENERSHHQV